MESTDHTRSSTSAQKGRRVHYISLRTLALCSSHILLELRTSTYSSTTCGHRSVFPLLFFSHNMHGLDRWNHTHNQNREQKPHATTELSLHSLTASSELKLIGFRFLARAQSKCFNLSIQPTKESLHNERSV